MNPYLEARTRVADTLTDLGVPVYSGSAPSLSGPCVILIAGVKDPRGQVEVEVMCSVPAAGTPVDQLDQLAWDTELAVRADARIHMLQPVSRITTDTSAQRLTRTLYLATRTTC